MVGSTRVKICGLTRVEDVEWALECGADAVGFVLEPSSPRCVSAELLAELVSAARRASPCAATVAVYGRLTCSPPPGPAAVQAVAYEADSGSRIRIQTVRLGAELPSLAGADAALLDAHVEGAYGGTGKTVDWDLASEFVADCPLQVILAGGLTPENVAEAIRRVKPYAVDVSSGVESSPGVKDRGKLEAFIRAARGPLQW